MQAEFNWQKFMRKYGLEISQKVSSSRYLNVGYQCTNWRKYTLEDRPITGCHLHEQLQVKEHHCMSLHLPLQDSGLGLAPHCTCSQITTVFLHIWLNLNTDWGNSINTAVLWTVFFNFAFWCPSRKDWHPWDNLFLSSLLLSFFRVAKMGQSNPITVHHELLE